MASLEFRRLCNWLAQANARIEADAGRNQDNRFIAVLLLGPLGEAVAGAKAETHEAEKAEIPVLYGRRDAPAWLAVFKGCGMGG